MAMALLREIAGDRGREIGVAETAEQAFEDEQREMTWVHWPDGRLHQRCWTNQWLASLATKELGLRAK